MLVEFRQSFVIQGTNVIKKRKYFWSKPEEVTQNICCTTYIEGICDEKDLDSEIKRLTEKELKSKGWGYKFSGWQRVMPRDECIELYKEHGWDLEAIPSYEIKITPINSWKMSKILETLTGEQFAQFCRDINISMKE